MQVAHESAAALPNSSSSVTALKEDRPLFLFPNHGEETERIRKRVVGAESALPDPGRRSPGYCKQAVKLTRQTFRNIRGNCGTRSLSACEERSDEWPSNDLPRCGNDLPLSSSNTQSTSLQGLVREGQSSQARSYFPHSACAQRSKM